MVGFAGFGSAIGDGIIGSKAVESIARQPEARPNIFFFYLLGVGILEAFPIIAIALAFFLLIGGGNLGVMKALQSVAK
ncbi:MAG: ATP synthase F0 subunit C [Candidatus Eremiobacteraeota bacterium]|nr:ATP synthase F0 subunit C [Candidatus Eremiobacteraeota bacterium]MBC5828389.1 ATP synthase F0 subunit C [Candidatus Eremiobacteraeota bacterium]